MSSLRFEIPYRAPYALRFHREGEVVQRSFWLQGVPVVVRLTQAGDNGVLSAELASDSVSTLDAAAVQQTIRHMVAADDDLGEFRAAVSRDARLTRLIDALPGLKPLRVPDLWTTLLRSLIAQQISTAAARSVRERLSRSFGRVIRIANDDVTVVPSPQTVGALSVDELARAGLSRRKAEYALGFAQAFTTGEIDPVALAAAQPAEMIAALTRLRGVGVWTAECVGIFCLGHRDLLPADDLGLQKAIAQLYGLRRDPSARDVAQLGKKWAGWRSYAAIYLWGGRNHGALPIAQLKAAKAKPVAAAKKVQRKAPQLPPMRTGARQHTPVAPGRRGR